MSIFYLNFRKLYFSEKNVYQRLYFQKLDFRNIANFLVSTIDESLIKNRKNEALYAENRINCQKGVFLQLNFSDFELFSRWLKVIYHQFLFGLSNSRCAKYVYVIP
jgi:hypothetical protein